MQKPQSAIEIQREEERIHALLALTSTHPAETDSCPDTEILAALIDNTISNLEEREGVLAHIAVCSDCYEIWLGTATQIHDVKEVLAEEVSSQEEWPSQDTLCCSAHIPEESSLEATPIAHKKPWYSHKAPAAAFMATACFVVFFGSRFILQPGTAPIVNTTDNIPLPTQQAEINVEKQRTFAIEKQRSSQRKRTEQERRSRSSNSRNRNITSSQENAFTMTGSAPSPRATLSNAQQPELHIWLKELTSDCRTGKETLFLSNQQVQELEFFLIATFKQSTDFDKEVFKILSRLRTTVTKNKSLIHCSELLSISDSLAAVIQSHQ